MTRITVLGGTGYTGRHIAATAAAKGHDVTTWSRSAPAEPVEGATHRTGDLSDPAVVAAAVEGADVVVSAVSPRGELAEQGALRGILATAAQQAQERGVRLGVIGGAGSLHVAEGGPLLVDTPDFPEAFAQEARELTAVLQDLRASDEALDWFFLSPAAGFGAYAPGEATGSYRTGGDVLLADERGESFISGEDLALAVVDEIEQPAHPRARFTVAY